MEPTPLHQLSAPERARRFGAIRLLATDVDGTLTKGNGLDPEVVAQIARLCARGIEVVPVSGRPAGEVLGLVRYLPGVRRGIAENGQAEVVPDRPVRWLAEPTDRPAIQALALQLGADAGLELRTTADDRFRVGDVAFERDGASDAVLAALIPASRARGLFITWSNVHIHFTTSSPDKGAALLSAAGVEGQAIATIGDAPNDAGLFVAGRFGATIGTADVLRQRAVMPAMPEFVTEAAESEGFLELARLLLGAQP
jgi:hydroxymethylpyrimidine pyrophosphatase-like HAD family hydrolase